MNFCKYSLYSSHVLVVISILLVVLVLLLIYPFDSLTIFPHAISYFSFSIVVDSDSLLFSIHPCAVILTTVWPSEYSMTLFFIIEVLSLVPPSISPGEQATAMHLIAYPVSSEFSAICPLILAITMDVIIEEVPLIR